MGELVGVNYRIIPMPEIVETVELPERDRPYPGAVSGVLKIRWTARTPILIGGDVVSGTRSLEFTDDNGERKRQDQGLYTHVLPLKLYSGGGRYCLSGSGLRGMVRAAYSVASASWPGPLFRRKALLNPEKRYALFGWPGRNRKLHQTIDDLIRRSLPKPFGAASGGDIWQGFLPDATDALFGYVKDFDPEDDGKQRDIWSTDRQSGPQQLSGRVFFDFALADDPPRFIEPFYLPGAEPKLRSPLYTRRNGDDPYPAPYVDPWDDPESRLAGGLKVYPIHPPDMVALKAAEGEPKAGRILHPLDEGVSFTGTIELENVLPEEFGRLMWSLFLDEAPDIPAADRDSLHGLGHARNYGLGALAPELVDGWLEVLPTEPGGAPPEARVDTCVAEARQRFAETADTAPRRAYLTYRSMRTGMRLKREGRLFSHHNYGGTSDVRVAVTPMLAPEHLGEVLKSLDEEVGWLNDTGAPR